jgi:hypothetical protein
MLSLEDLNKSTTFTDPLPSPSMYVTKKYCMLESECRTAVGRGEAGNFDHICHNLGEGGGFSMKRLKNGFGS